MSRNQRHLSRQIVHGNLSDQWNRQGYVVVPDVLDGERVTRLRRICDRILAQWRIDNPETGQPGGGLDAHVMRHLNHVGYFPDQPPELAVLLDVVADDKVLDVMRSIFDEEPLFRCISYFFNPQVASQDGNWHRDSQFSAPEDAAEQSLLATAVEVGNSIQMQIPLVPSDDIEVVPQSHLRWDTPQEYAIRKGGGGAHNRSDNMPGAVRLQLEAGDALLFNPMALHRGRYHVDKLRRTLMLTFTRSSAPHFDYFSNQPWFLTPGYLVHTAPSTHNFFQRFIHTYTEHW